MRFSRLVPVAALTLACLPGVAAAQLRPAAPAQAAAGVEIAASAMLLAGVSWQWQKSPHIDVRIDLQGVCTGAQSFFVAPLATFSMVWHRERRWS